MHWQMYGEGEKHHAWKVIDPDIYLYGEDIYGVHSIAYDPVQEDRTFYAFALRDRPGSFAPFAEVEAYANKQQIPVVPVLYKGRFGSVAEIRKFIDGAHKKCSVLGGEREGIVLQSASGFRETPFRENVCKSIRADHVRSDSHWTKNWKPCKIVRGSRSVPRFPSADGNLHKS